MQVVLIGLSERVVDAARRVLGPSAPPVVGADVNAVVAALGATPASVVMVSGERADFADVCAELRCQACMQDATIVACLATPSGLNADLLSAGARDFYVESLGEDLLKMRLAVAHRSATQVVQLRQAEDETNWFFEMSFDLLCIASIDGFFRRTNSSWTRTTGWSAKELTSRPWLDFVHPDDIGPTLAAGAQLRGHQYVTEFTNRYRCQDGTYRWLEWSSVPAAETGLIYAVARDVTQARLVRRDMEDLAESLRTTLSSIGDAVISTDLEMRIVRMNPVAELLTGWLAADAVGHSISEVLQLIDATSLAPLANPALGVIQGGPSVELSKGVRILRRDGTTVPIGDSCSPIRDSTGAVRGAVLVFRDLTRDIEAELARTKVQDQLIFADRMASVGTLAAGVAHEINNPLTYVISNLDSIIEEIRELSGGSTSGRMRELEDMALEAMGGAERVRKIVRGLKTFSRAADERKAVVELRPILELSINMAFNEIRHRAQLVKDFGRTPAVDVDDARLGQVFINLLVNAAQAIITHPRDNHEIRIVTYTDPQGRAVVEIRDTGPGIPAALISRIFDPFFTTKPVGIGTGLGLSICHSIIESMGGAITVESQDGQGATFRVVIPPAAAAPNAQLAAPREQTRAAVLVIDDEPAIGMAISRVLRAHDVTVLTSAVEALALLEGPRRFDVIISDVMMPQMSGIELYDKLATRLPDVAQRMVFVTGGATTPSVVQFLDRISNERLDKPFAPESLRALVAKYLPKGERRAE